MNTNKRHKWITNLSEVEPFQMDKGRFGTKSKVLALTAGAKELGCNWFELSPGKTSFPHHYHTGIEEAIFILKGKASLRVGEERVEVQEGDYISFPAGPEAAHSLTNTSSEPVQYLCMSNHSHVDVMGYPDSKKFHILATPNPAEWPPKSAWIALRIKDQPSEDYFEGENLEKEK